VQLADRDRRVTLRAAAMLMAAVALAACTSSDEDASDAAVLSPDGSSLDGAPSGDGDGDLGDGHGDGDGDGDGDQPAHDGGDVVELDAATDAMSGDAGEDGGDASDGDAAESDASDAMLPALEDLPYGREVISFTAGDSAGFGQAMYPDIVYGPPKGKGTGSGSLDVLSLGVGGEIVIGFGELDIVDGDGADFIVFENAFISNGTTFEELGEVAVSDDGETWHSFECDVDGNEESEHAGCAGWSPTLRYDPQLVFPLDPELTGGNAFDLAMLGVTRARYVRIRDLETQPGSANTGGFDLDAVGLVNYETRD
jgi:hypothetical protein